MDDRLKRQFDLNAAKARLFDELVDTLQAITTDERKHPDVLESVEVALKVAKLRRTVEEKTVALRYPEVRS